MARSATKRKDTGRKRDIRGRYDRQVVLAVVTLACFGLVMVTSSSIAVADREQLGAFYYMRRHLAFLCLGGGLLLVAARIELSWVEAQHRLLLLAGLVALLAVWLPGIGASINGARRWLDLGVSTFQPVEAIKVVVVIYLASYLVRHHGGVKQRFSGAFNPIIVVLLFAALLVLQPDFGSAVLLLAVAVGMIWLGGARMRDLVMMGTPLVLLAAMVAFSEDYRVQRLTSFLNPWQDPFNDGFQLTQALIAIGRGQWFGVGLGASVQKLSYLPEAHTDFILAVIGEELGLAGVLTVLSLYLLLMARGLLLGLRGVNVGQPFAAYLAFGTSLSVGLQALVSIGVNLGVLPTKGLTLPLISSGGSSVVMTCVMMGLLLRAGYEIDRAERQRASIDARDRVIAATEAMA